MLFEVDPGGWMVIPIPRGRHHKSKKLKIVFHGVINVRLSQGAS